jgi:hypothetical protein
MKLAEFKKIIRPLIKECIKEVILEEGILSNVVSEVAKGLRGNLVMESKSSDSADEETRLKAATLERERQERIKRLNESARMNVDVFEGTKEVAEPSQASPLQGVPPGDAGVDISGIVNMAGNKWKHLK